MNDEANPTPAEESVRQKTFRVSCPLCGSSVDVAAEAPIVAQAEEVSGMGLSIHIPVEAEADASVDTQAKTEDSLVTCPACGLTFQPPMPEPLPIEPEVAPLPDDPASLLKRWLEGESIESDAIKIPRRRFYRKYPGTTALVILALVVGAIASAVPTVAYLRVSSELAQLHIDGGQAAQELRSRKQNLERQLQQQRQELLNQDEAAAERLRQAERRADRALSDVKASWSRRLSADAVQLRDTDQDRSVLLAAEALHLTSTGDGPLLPGARQILHDWLDGNDGRRLAGHTAQISSLAINSEGRLLASGSFDRTVRLWNLDDADPTKSVRVLDGHGGHVTGVEFGPNNQRLVSGSLDSIVRIWDLGVDGAAPPPMLLPGHQGRIGIVTLSPNGRWLITGSSGISQAENSTRLWDLSISDLLDASVELPGHTGRIHVIVVSPDNRWILTAGEGGTARLWDVTAEQPEATSISLNGHGGDMRCASFSTDSRYLLTGSDNAASDGPTLNLWHLTDEKLLSPVALPGHATGVRATLATPDAGRMISLGKDNTIRIWNLAGRTPVAEKIVLPGAPAIVERMTISPDGRWLVTGDNTGTARIWDLANRNAPWTTASSVALQGDQGRITAMTISPDNRWLIVAGDDNVIRMWTLRVEELVDLALERVGRQRTLRVLASNESTTLVPPPRETGRTAATSPALAPARPSRIPRTSGPLR